MLVFELTTLLLIGVEVQVDTSIDPTPPTKLDLMVDVSQLVTDDSIGHVHRLFTDLRLRTEADDLFGLKDFAFSFDGRGRFAYSEDDPYRYDLTRAYFQYGKDERWSVGLGRIPILEIGTAQIDGGRFAVGLADGFNLSAYGGLIPHPITSAFNKDFAGGGLAYALRSSFLDNAGGVHAQVYQGQLDRVYAAERLYLAVGRSFSFFTNAIVDFVTPGGVDLTNALAVVRYRPFNFIDFSLTGTHVHAILPNKWWQDWIEQERARLGFTLDGVEPVGTRRTSGRFVTNFHILDAISPYVAARYDYRHEDGAQGWEGRAGVKLARPTLGYVDLSGAMRDYFGVRQQTGGIQAGFDGLTWFGADAGFSVLNAEGIGLIYDVNATLWGQLGPVRLTALYQVFVEPDLYYQLFFIRAGYRFSG